MFRLSTDRQLPGRFTLLLVLLPTAMLVAPLLADSIVGRALFNTFLTLVLLGSISATGLKKREQVAAWTLVVVTVLVRWAGHFIDNTTLQMTGDILTALFLGFVTVELFLHVVRAKQVDTNVLSAALCVYLLLGMTFALLYTGLDRVAPASFDLPMNPAKIEASRSFGRTPDFIYYSMIAMTTTGLGDIRPVSQLARSLTIVEILLGQLYLVVMISRLVTSWGMKSSAKD